MRWLLVPISKTKSRALISSSSFGAGSGRRHGDRIPLARIKTGSFLMATLKKLSSPILMALVVGCALVQMTNGFMVQSFPEWRLDGWNKLPGFKARITQKGLDFFRDVGLKTLQKRIREMRIPDQRGKAGKVSYSATNIKITSVGLPANISPQASINGLTFNVRKGSFGVHGNLKYKLVFSKHGTFDATLSAISLDTSIQVGVDSTGRPTVTAKGCQFNVGSVKVKIHGGIARLFDKKVAEQLKHTLNQKVCISVIQAINRDLAGKLKNLNVTIPYKGMFLFDYSLVQSPTFNGSVDTSHKGEVYPVGNATECPIPIPAIPQDPDRSSKMLFLWVTDYLPNSAAYVLQKTGQLQHTVTPKNAPPEAAKYLNTSSIAVKMLLPQIGERYPNMAMLIQLNSTVTPTVKITPKGIEAVLTAFCSPSAILPNKTTAFLFTLGVTITAELTVGSNGNNITWVITSFSTVLKEVRSEIGTIPINKLQTSVDMAIKIAVLPKLNRMGVVGVPLPQMRGFMMVNTNVALGQGYLKIGTNLVHP